MHRIAFTISYLKQTLRHLYEIVTDYLRFIKILQSDAIVNALSENHTAIFIFSFVENYIQNIELHRNKYYYIIII